MVEPEVSIKRKIYTYRDIENEFPESKSEKGETKPRISGRCLIANALTLFPIVQVLRRYTRKNIISDILAGLSVAFMHLPQGLGFGLLASLEPIYGLYSTFYPVLMYFIFGTSPHVSMGTNAVMAVLTASVVEREAELMMNARSNGTKLYDQEILQYKVGISMILTFVAGVILLLMGLLRLGFLTNYLAVSFIGGFTTASAFHITTSQIGKMLNIAVKPYAGPGKIVKTFMELFSKIGETNMADLTISILCILILLLVKVFVNEKYKDKLKIPIPIDLIVVIIATFISFLADFHAKFDVAIVGNVPTGMPPPQLPTFESTSRVAMDSFVVAILIFALTISMAKLMARSNKYEVDDNQELVAYGMSNLFSSFFQCFPACVSPPRTMILQDLNCKTTLNGIISAIFIMVILLAAGPLFSALPVAVLAAMIVVAMKDLLLQFRLLPSIWRVSVSDCVIWIMTVLVGVFVDLDYGILTGVGISILSVIINNQLSKGYSLALLPETGLILDKTNRKDIEDKPGVKVFTFESQLYFVNAERFRKLLYSKTIDPTDVSLTYKNKPKLLSRSEIYTADVPQCNEGTEVFEKTQELPEESEISGKGEAIHHVIIDCVNITYIDMAGVNIIKQIILEYSDVGIHVMLARVPQYMYKTLEKADILKICPQERIFYDVFDAFKSIDN